MKGDRSMRRNRYLEEAMLFRNADFSNVIAGARKSKRSGLPLSGSRFTTCTVRRFAKPKFFQVFFVLDIFSGILASDSTVGFFYAIFHCPFDNEIQCNQNG